MKLLSGVIAVVALLSVAASAQEQQTKLVFKTKGVDAARKLVLNHDSNYRDYIKGGMMSKDDIAIAEADLNGDEVKEIFAYTSGSLNCGSAGCTLTVYEKQGEKLRQLMYVGTYDDIRVSTNLSRGFKTIVLRGSKGNPLPWRFNGKEFSPK